MPSSLVIRAIGSEGAAQVIQWMKDKRAAGTSFFSLEGIPGSGKSYLGRLCKQHGFDHIELDNYFPSPAPDDISWIELVAAGGALAAISKALDDKVPTVAEGPAAWPVVAKCLGHAGPKQVRRIYVKEMSTSGGVIEWQPCFDMLEYANSQNAFWHSVYAHHAIEKPWLYADLVFERLPEPDDD